jgi:hypothetical protein
VVGLFVVVPLVAAALATAWPTVRKAMLSIPMPVMVALNILRVFAVLFLMLAAEGRLTGPFPYSAAWGDIITGVVAVPVLWLLKDGVARHSTAIAAWNLFGTADLVLAIAAYNAGSGNVNRWRKAFGELPRDEFVESIPYPETREYVKKVLSSTEIYSRMYKLDRPAVAALPVGTRALAFESSALISSLESFVTLPFDVSPSSDFTPSR